MEIKKVRTQLSFFRQGTTDDEREREQLLPSVPRMPPPSMTDSLAGLLDQSQDGVAGHAKLLAKCQKLYKEVSID